MKIVHYYEGRCNPYSGAGGVDKTVGGLCEQHGAAGHEVHLFGLSSKPEIPIPRTVVRNYSPVRFRFSIPKGMFHDLEAFGPDVMHLHSAYVPRCIRLSRWARRRGIPYVVTPNGNCSSRLLKHKALVKVPYRRFFELPYLNRAAFVHSVGDHAEIERYGVTVPIVRTLNGFEMETVPEDPDLEVIEKRLPEWKNRTILLFLGRLDIQQKGLDLLLAGLELALKDGADVGLVVVGMDWKGSRERIERLANDRGLNGDVHFWGPAFGKEKFDLLRAADCFVHTSRWEGMSFAVAEALACRQLCLLTPAADPGGLVAKLDGGVIVGEEPREIAAGIRRIVEASPDELGAMKETAGRIVSEYLDWKRIADTVMEAYHEVAGVPRNH